MLATAPRFLLNKVNILHDKIVRYVNFSKACCRVWPLYKHLDIQPLEILMELEWGKMIYKFQNNRLQKAFDCYFKRPRHSHATRYVSQNNFELVRPSSAREQTLLKFIGPKKWSEIPTSIKNAPYLKTFKRMLKEHLVLNYK